MDNVHNWFTKHIILVSIVVNGFVAKKVANKSALGVEFDIIE